jgi:hypothetical protein
VDRKWLTFGVLAAGLVAVSLLVGLSSGGGSTGPPLQLERATATDGRPELLVTVSDSVNVESNARGPTVGLKCRDGKGAMVLDARHTWPLERDGEPPAPHIHQPASQIELSKIDRCQITGTRVELAGRLGIR